MSTTGMRPRNAVFAALRDRWLGDEPGRTSLVLADELGCRQQVISTFATGSEGRVPSWSTVMRLCRMTGSELRLHPDGIVVTRARSGPDGLATRQDDTVIAITDADLAGPMPL